MIKNKPTKFLIKKIITSVSPPYYFERRYIKKTEYLSKNTLDEIQFQKLRKVITEAYENVPYYRRCWQAIGFNPGDFNKIDDISKLPLIDKNVCRENINELISRKAIKKLLPTVYTGGTTGAPLLLYRSISDYARERAYLEYAYKTTGMNHSVKTVYIRGKVADDRGRYHQVSDFGNTLYLSSHNMRDSQLAEYIQRIRDFKPVLLYTLPSVAAVLAEYMQRNNIESFKTLKWVYCPSENLYDFQRKLIEKILKCKIGIFYGHAEHAVFAVRCEHSDMYHVLPQYGYCELIDNRGQQVREEGVIGEIVGTTFSNLVSPLVRYRTGDYAFLSKKKCSCKRNFMMLEKLQGREQSLAIDKRNARISVGPELLCTIHDKSYKMIKQFRIEQKKAGELDILIDTYKDDNFDIAGKLFKGFLEKEFPGLFDIKIKRLDISKNKTVSDKHLYFVQHIK